MGKALPKQVQDQIDEAEAIAQQIEAAQNPASEQAPDLQVVSPEAAPDDLEANLQPHDKNLSFEAEQPTSDEISTADLEAEAAAVVATEVGEPDNFEHKYKTLQGMYNREKQNVADLTGRVNNMEGLLAGLQSAREQADLPPVAETAPAVPALTEEEINDYGPDLVSVIKRAAVEAVQGELDTLKRENADLKAAVGTVGQSQERTVKEVLYSDLAEQVPNWKQVNTHPDFLEWLNQEDVYAGVARGQMLSRAFSQNDTKRVVQFFKGFLSENAALQPAANTTPAPVVEDIPQPKVDLASLASPGQGSGGGADNINETGRMWRESEIGTFYEDARKGHFKGREDDYKATEREIQLAMNQGRILVGQ